MENHLSPARLEIANRCWADTVKKACGANPSDRLHEAQFSKLTEFVLRQLCVPKSQPLFNFRIPAKKRGSPATTTNVSKIRTAEKPNNIENVKIKKPNIPRKRVCPGKIKKQRKMEEEAVVTVMPLPGNFREAMMGMGVVSEDKIKFLVQKEVTGTDVGKTQNRLQIPVKKIKASEGFLTAEEESRVDSPDGLVVKVIEPSCEEVCELRLRLWRMNKNEYYALVNRHQSTDDSPNKWHGLVTRNRIQEHDTLQLWSFRVGLDSKLCLAIVKC